MEIYIVDKVYELPKRKIVHLKKISALAAALNADVKPNYQQDS